MIKVNLLSPAQKKAAELILKFQEAFRSRPFSGRNAELGKMFNCPACGLRHREATSQCHRGLTVSYVKEAVTKHSHPAANPFWRAKPGKIYWVAGLNKFMTIDHEGQKIWDSVKHKLVAVTPIEGKPNAIREDEIGNPKV